jgi:tetratricopeptide (TPR) repeat protein
MRNIFRYSIAALFVISAVAVFAQTPTARISATWQVVRYDITATLPQGERDRVVPMKATLQFRNVSDRPAASLTLRISPDAAITSVTINGSAADITTSQEKAGAVSLQRAAVRMPGVASGATVTAVVDYRLTVKDNSGLHMLSPVGAQFLPMAFWYPTPNSWFFARGADFAPTRLQITAPAGRTVIAPGRLNGGTYESDLNLQPFFLAGNWDRTEHSGAAVYIPKGTGGEAEKRAAEIGAFAVEARGYVEKLLGPAPAADLRIVGVRRGSGFSSGGMILVDEGLFRRPKLDSLSALTVAEGVVKMWLGDRALVTDDGSGVIREGLARHIATQFIGEKFGTDVAELERLRQRIAYASVSRRDAPLFMVAPLDDFYFPAVANKGAMFWRLLERKIGRDPFYEAVRERASAGTLRMADLRAEFSSQKAFLDYMLDSVTDMNLQAGLPQVSGGEAKVALRNTGETDVTVNVQATLANGETMTVPATIRAASFGEVVFKTTQQIMRVEIDPEKLYPQSDYSDDVQPRESSESDQLLAVKQEFDRQEFASAEKLARGVLARHPRYDDVRVLLARSLLAQNKVTEAETEFKAVLAEKLPTARSIAWAYLGLAETASKTGRGPEAVTHANNAIMSGGDYGAGLLARAVRKRHTPSGAVDEAAKAFFAQFDKAAISNRKAELDALALPGDVDRFVSGISGQATEWRTEILHTDRIDEENLLVEANISVRLLTREPESGPAVFRLVRTPSGWRLSGVEIFEVR